MLLRRYKNRRAKVPAVLVVEPVEEKPVEEMTVDELRAYAEEHEIDLGKATSLEGIRKKVQEALEEQPE